MRTRKAGRFEGSRWARADRVNRLITEDASERVAADTAYKNAR
jgi:hypothetical protein